jgi:hypothetical protein
MLDYFAEPFIGRAFGATGVDPMACKHERKKP